VAQKLVEQRKKEEEELEAQRQREYEELIAKRKVEDEERQSNSSKQRKKWQHCRKKRMINESRRDSIRRGACRRRLRRSSRDWRMRCGGGLRKGSGYWWSWMRSGRYVKAA
jgi:hypothetical protein